MSFRRVDLKEASERRGLIAVLFAPAALIASRWNILTVTVWSELRSMYAGSILGVGWVVAAPLVLMFLYAIVYGLIFRIQPANMTFSQYVLYVLTGLVPFMAFSSSLTIGAMSLSKNKQVLLNTFYPSELIGVRTVLAQHAQMVVGLAAAVMFAAALALAGWSLLILPVIVVCQLMFTCALVWLLSLVTLALRDIQFILQYLMFALLIVTPIGYDRNIVPPLLHWLMYFNPLFYFVAAYQDAIVFGRIPDALILCIMIVGSVVSFSGGYAIFRRAKQIFYDYA